MNNENIAGTKSGVICILGDHSDIGKMVHVATVVVPKEDHGSLGQEG